MPFGAGAVWPTGQGRPRACSASAVAVTIAGMKRKRLWLLALAIPVIIGAGYVFVPLKESGINEETCDAIQLGWDWGQVLEFLGLDLGDAPQFGNLMFLHDREGLVGCTWWDEDGNTLAVYSDDKGIVSKKFTPTKLSLPERMKGRIERRIRALWP